MALSVLKNSRLLVPKNQQCLTSSITNACRKGGPRGKGVVHSADTVLSSTFGLLIENHVHVPLVAFVPQWDLLTDVERL
jgi:hypothetical protein